MGARKHDTKKTGNFWSCKKAVKYFLKHRLLF
jgi:hypothetical protein